MPYETVSKSSCADTGACFEFIFCCVRVEERGGKCGKGSRGRGDFRYRRAEGHHHRRRKPHAARRNSRAGRSHPGCTLEVKEFQDYVQPNNVVESGEFDANYFQHIPYLENFNEEQGTHLVNAGGIHYEPFGIYPGTKSSLDDIAEGDTIAVPNDTTNEARALLLLQDNGILKLKDGAGLTATVLDIEENPYNVEILELEAAQVPRVKDEVAYVVLNGNYALDAGFSVAKDSLAYEKSDSDAAKTYVNVIAVKEGNENSEKILALVGALKSDAIRQYINDTYDGAVVPFDD